MLLVAVVAIAALAAGCGGDDDGDSGSQGAGTTASADTGSNSASEEEGDGGSAGSDDGSGGSEESAGGGSPPSKAEFIKKANTICYGTIGEAQAEIPEVSDVTPKPTVVVEAVESTLAPAFHEVAEQLGELEAPAGDEGALTALVKALEEEADELEEVGPTAKNWSDLPPVFKESTAIAREYGITACTYAD